MEYKTKGKEGTSTRGQRKESKLAKVNKKRGNDAKRPGKEKKEKADDVSNSFPNFNVLTEEERLVFFEALSVARKNIEGKGLPTRERFGTVHDEYLNYFTNNEKKEEPQKKPESVSSVRPSWSPVAVRKNAEVKLSESPRDKVKSPKPSSPLTNKLPRSPQKGATRPESAPAHVNQIDKCESVIRQETDKVIKMYFEKKKRVEEAWRKSVPVNKFPQPKTMVRKSPLIMTNKEEALQPKKKTVGEKSESKAKTFSKASDTPQFHSLNLAERQEFFRILEEAHNNILERNPQKEILTLNEMLSPYKSGKKIVVGTAFKELQTTKKKNLRVNITLTSGDNERLSKSKSQIFSDQAKEESSERSKSLESLQSSDTIRGKQSKIPVFTKSMDIMDEEECCDDDSAASMKKPSEDINKTPPKPEEKKKQASIKEKALDEKEKPREVKNVAKEKTKIITKTKKNEEEVIKNDKKNIQETNKTRNVGLVKLKVINLEKRKAECRKALKEKESRAAEAAKKEKEFLKKKKVEERKKRHQKETFPDVPLLKKDWDKGTDKSTDYCPKPVRVRKKVTPGSCKEKVQNRKAVKAEIKYPTKEKESVKELQEEKANEAGDECSELLEERAKGVEEECIEEEKKLMEELLDTQENKVEEQYLKEKEEPVKEPPEEKVKQAEEEYLDEEKKSAKEVREENKKNVEEYLKEKQGSEKELREEIAKKAEENLMEKRELKKETNTKKKDEYEDKDFKKKVDHRIDATDLKPQIIEVTKQESLCFAGTSSKPNYLDRQNSTESEEESEEESFECVCDKTESEKCERNSLMAPEMENLCEFLGKNESEQILRTATHSAKSFGGVSLVGRKPEEMKKVHECLSPCKSKAILVDESVIGKIKSLILYLENKVKPAEKFENEYVRLVKSYTEYLAKTAESLRQRNAELGQRVHSTYNAHEVHLKFQDSAGEKPKEETKKPPLPRSISESELPGGEMPKLSGIEKKPKEKIHRRQSSLDLLMVSDSESSSNSEGENQTLVSSSFKKAGIPTTKIRLLQDLLKGRAGYVAGSIDEFKIVRYPEPEFIPTDKPQTSKELTENDEDQNEKVIRLKFFKNLANLCRCGRKQVEEDDILENLKGEAVKVNTTEDKKDPASATINQSTMEVLKAAERKKIIEKYFKLDQS